ncbi:TrgA family protein [Sulfitobacter mediterraneus]|uniref:Tellurium resistance protein n=1 Tax=Sulfitobacter mediterraneus TaxID=83219 RepID=A0A061SXE6_9RHOB|nr:TrgA family protein [Sulfitobacter mediterraneus]KAJ04679.1 tellurium resistance protein [Sulfitobacter mediterraneus]MBM1557066.1 TrgA family protein [Sulfitobacter mediterraneus]MBM1568112.1 TrgA family protein [Sulfitobacter mediterraneus]MBM1572285.1 TrgA family protein [Sulfitobacter mediterraneus]MBM1576074.1 TrgA family protein [Sulfitobacter mediterraneus]
MPTAAKLTAAICLAAVGYILSLMVMPLMPESTDFGYFIQLNAVLGLFVGWLVMGRRAGRGTTAAINNGLTGVFVLMLWGVGVQAINEMIRLAMRNRYDGPFEAMVAVFQIGAEFAVIVITVPIVIVAVIASIISGLLVEFAHKHGR